MLTSNKLDMKFLWGGRGGGVQEYLLRIMLSLVDQASFVVGWYLKMSNSLIIHDDTVDV